MTNVKSAAPSRSIRVSHYVDRATVGQQVVEFGVIGELVDPHKVDQKQPARIVGRGIEAIEIHRLPSVVGAHAYEVALVTHNVDQLELFEEGGDRRKTLADLWSRLDGDAERGRIVEKEAQEHMPDRPFDEVRYIEVEGDQVRQQNLPLLIAHREIIPGTVVEVTHTGQAHEVAVDA